MTLPLLRVVVAGAAAAELQIWLADLQSRLPSEVLCVSWPVADLSGNDRLLLLSGDGSDSAELAAESALRATLTTLAGGYQVIQAPHATQQALHAIGRALLPIAPSLAEPMLRAPLPARWHGVCEGCSDPGCEYRLFTALRERMAGDDGSLQG